MSEIQNENVQTEKRFLDYGGLSKFWELAKKKSAGELVVDINNETGANIVLKHIDTPAGSDEALSTHTIPIASETFPGLMSKEQAKKLEDLYGSVNNMGELNGIAFGSGENIKLATIGSITVPDGNDTNTLDKYLNLDFIVEDNALKIIDLNSANTVLSSVELKDIFSEGFIEYAEIVEQTVDDPENPGYGVKNVYLKLEFKYADGEHGEVLINVNDLFTEYTAGLGLELVDVEGSEIQKDKHTGKFQVKIKNDEEFLEVTGEGLSTKGIKSTIEDSISNTLESYYNKIYTG